MPEKNQVFTTEITGLTSEGSGVCRIDGMAVFVPETAVGDVAEVKIVKVLSSYAYGIVNRIVTPSPDRIDCDCSTYKKCGGCVFRHISYEAECRAKDEIVRNAFRRIGGLSPEFDEFLPSGSSDRYRNKAQYPLAVIEGKAVCGFYAPRSHRVVPLTDCPLHPEVFSEILKVVLGYVNEKKIPVYDEKSGNGLLRNVYIRQGAHSGEIMVCIVARKNVSRQLTGLCRALTEKFPEIKSIVLNINPNRTNVILGSECVTLWGSDVISDTMCGNTVEISPLSFYQINTSQAERLYAKALEYADPEPSAVIADLFCGAGTIGLSMAHRAAKIIGIEIVPDAVVNARQNAARNGISNAEFHCGDAGEIFDSLRKNGCSPDIIVVDPPRKGCSADTVRIIADAQPRKIVMISCNPSTAARDSALFCDLGYSVERICGADFFPRTRHVETVVLMSRNLLTLRSQLSNKPEEQMMEEYKMFDPGLNIGEVLKNSDIVEKFKCGNMGGMRRSKTTNTLVIVSDYTKGIYHDKWIGGVLHYTGMGKSGDQDINWAQNATLAECGRNGVDVHLFEVMDAGEYIYCGRIELVDKPYTEIQPDEDGIDRQVWMFPIRPVPDNDVKKPSIFVFADMEDYKIRGKKVDSEYSKILAEKKKHSSKTSTLSTVVPAIKKTEPKPPVVIPADILGKKVKHKLFGVGTITSVSDTIIDVNFGQVGLKKMGYEFCVKNNMLEFI